jgi:hypothetical protein
VGGGVWPPLTGGLLRIAGAVGKFVHKQRWIYIMVLPPDSSQSRD